MGIAEVINSETGERELQTELKEDVHISSHLTCYDNGYVYFSALLDNSIPVFGAVDAKSGELEFIQEVEMQGERSFRNAPDKPIVVGDRLYIRDALKTLHIYARE
jgi:6-phosphogluconolactonase (cycloisomerase 2 family)